MTEPEHKINIHPEQIPDYAMNYMGRHLLKVIEKFYEDPANMEEFKAWYLERYGKPFEEASNQ